MAGEETKEEKGFKKKKGEGGREKNQIDDLPTGPFAFLVFDIGLVQEGKRRGGTREGKTEKKKKKGKPGPCRGTDTNYLASTARGGKKGKKKKTRKRGKRKGLPTTGDCVPETPASSWSLLGEGKKKEKKKKRRGKKRRERGGKK